MKSEIIKYLPSPLVECAIGKARMLVEGGGVTEERAFSIVAELDGLKPFYQFVTGLTGKHLRVHKENRSWIQLEGDYLAYYDAGQDSSPNPRPSALKLIEGQIKEYHGFGLHQIEWLMEQEGVSLMPKHFTVWVGSTEVNDSVLDVMEAAELAERYGDLGYTDVKIIDLSRHGGLDTSA